MNIIHHKLGHVAGDSVVEVTLKGNAANVRLMDTSNFNNYKAGRRHRYQGGLVKKSPVRLRVPHAGTWHVAVDMQGLKGTVRSGARVIPAMALKPLPPINESPLRDVPTLVRDAVHDRAPKADVGAEQIFDVFISHASEDKDEVVRPLAIVLQTAGLRVWFDEFELRIGDSLRRKIDKGLASSRFGVVILSRAFFGRGWTEYELDGLVTRAVSGEQILLPIWHNLTKREVMEYSPSLADRLARNTATQTVEEIAAEIVDVILNPTARPGVARGQV